MCTSSSVLLKASTKPCGSLLMKPTVSMSSACAAARQRQPPHRRIERREELVLDQHAGRGEPVHQRRLAGVGVADERDGRIRHAGAALPMQAARARTLPPAGAAAPRCARARGGGRPRAASRRVRACRRRRPGATDAATGASGAAAGTAAAPARPAACRRGCWARCAKMSRMSWLRSMTLTLRRLSRLRCCAGDKLSSKMATLPPAS